MCISEFRQPSPEPGERLHVVVSFGDGRPIPNFFQALDAIRCAFPATAVSFTLVCPSDHKDIIDHLQACAASVGLSVAIAGSNPVQSINYGIEDRPRGSHVLLLSPEVVIRSEAVRLMLEALNSDDMIGFVAPRSNIPTLSQFPQISVEATSEVASAEALFQRLSGFLPKIHFVPLPSSDCLLVRATVLDEFGSIDTTLPAPGVAGLDLVLRANRCGYSTALANRAYCWCAEPAQAAQNWNNAVDQTCLLYPELSVHVRAYLQGPQFEADRLLVGLRPDEHGRRTVLFDLSSFATYQNGTFEAGRCILLSAAQTWTDFRILAMSTPEARNYHQLNEISGIEFVPLDYDQPCAVAFRFGQPFAFEHIRRMSRAAPINVWAMLDTIAWDCLYLRRPELEEIWSGALEHGDRVIYISEAVRRSFHTRFCLRPSLPEDVIHLSLDLQDYRSPTTAHESGAYVLIIGNSYAHKRVAETAAALSSAFPDFEIVCLGGNWKDYRNVRFHESGNLSESFVNELFSGASILIYPSMHEGFGLPVLKGLGYKKPVLARALPAIEELAAQLGFPKNLLLYSSTPELLDLFRHGLPKWQTEVLTSAYDWDAVAIQIRVVLEKALNELQYEEVLLPRVRFSQGGFSNTEMAKRVGELERSLSWRMTGPVRALFDIFLRH